jgi:F-box interacting protein
MELPHDIAFEIFSWLPAKSVCKLKSTSESFSKLLEETTFKTKQTHNLSMKDDTCFFIQPDQTLQKYEKRVELHSLPKEKQSSGIPNDVLKFLSNSSSILASCNGLVLCRAINDDQLDLFICNPITKSWSSIPTPESLQINRNFANINIMLDCSHDNPDDYLVFLFEDKREWSPTYICHVYNGKKGAWKTMGKCFYPGGRNMKFNMPVFHNKAIYFISDSYYYFAKSSPFYEPYIMSYNLENGTSTMLKLPNEALRDCHNMCNMSIFKWGKVTSSNSSICLVKLKNSVFDVWILEDYNSSTWKKVLEVRVGALGLKEKNLNVIGFTVMNGDLLVFATEKNVYSYGLNGEKFMIVEEICQHNCGSKPHFISYSDTLRSCGTIAEIMPC